MAWFENKKPRSWACLKLPKVSERTAQRYHKEKGLPVKINIAGHPVIQKKDAEKWKLNQGEE